MNDRSIAARSGRAIILATLTGLMLTPAREARAQAASPQPESRWASEHVDLNMLPVAYVVRRGHLSVGGPVTMTPAGFAADTYSLYPALAYGITARTEAMFGVTGAERLGPGGEAVFYGLGLQHALLLGNHRLPALSLGGYGFVGPKDHHGGAVYLVASRQLTRYPYPRGVFGHLGVELQTFANSGSSTGVQPFIGANYVWNRRVRFSGEFRPSMPWEHANLYSLRAVVLVTRKIGISGGLRNNGYRTHPFIGIHID